MVKIRVRGPATVLKHRDTTTDDARVVYDATVLETLHGLEHDEVFSDYLGDGLATKSLVGAGVSGGRLRFEFDRERQRLYGVTEYSAPRLLTPSELALLMKYTIGQWSDGIGSNFFQNRMDCGLAPSLTQRE